MFKKFQTQIPISEIYGPIILPKELAAKRYPKSTPTRNFKAIKPVLFQESVDIQNSFFSFLNFLLKKKLADRMYLNFDRL